MQIIIQIPDEQEEKNKKMDYIWVARFIFYFFKIALRFQNNNPTQKSIKIYIIIMKCKIIRHKFM